MWYVWIIGGAVTLWGLVMLLNRLRFYVAGERTNGTIIGITERRQQKGGTTFHPRIRYLDLHGQAHEFVGQVGNSLTKPPLNQTVTVCYLRHQPHKALLLSPVSLWLAPVVLLGLGGVTLAVAAGVFN